MDNRIASSGCNRQTKTSALPTQVTNAQQLRRQSSPLGSLVDQQFPAAALSRHTDRALEDTIGGANHG
jgi:hypothetical protein